MEHTLLCNLGGPHKPNVILRLRLLHMWSAKSPGDSRVYNYCSLWADETGVLIHALSPPTMTSGIRRCLRVGEIYVIRSFGLTNPPNLYRVCAFDLALSITPSTSFTACALPCESFPKDAYEFLSFSQIPSRNGDHRLLTDVVGRLHSISGISHKITNSGPTVKQTVVLQDESGQQATITLWDEFSAILDHVALTQADAIEPIILAFGGLLVNRLGSYYVLSSSAATRVAVNPPVPKAYHLATRFAQAPAVVASLPVEFATAVDADADAERRTKTLAQLVQLSQTNANLEEKHRCGGVIVDVESHVPWYYNSCRMCLKAVSRRRDNSFWCAKDWQLQEEQTRVCYKIQLTLRDGPTEARFIVMGGCGHALVNVSAAYFSQRFPYRPGKLPPQLNQLLGQYIKFDCKLPLPGPAGFSSGEFRVTQVVTIANDAEVADLLEYHPQPALPAPVHVVPPAHASLALEGAGTRAAKAAEGTSRLSSAAKGKAKVSDLLLLKGPAQEFRIGDYPPSDSMVPLNASDPIMSASAPYQHVYSGLPQGAHRSGIVIGTESQAALSCHGSGRSAGLDVPGETPVGFTLADTSNASASGSHSASLLLSPLAKIKVEKLDAADGGSPASTEVTVPFTIGTQESSAGQQKKGSAKRSLFQG